MALLPYFHLYGGPVALPPPNVALLPCFHLYCGHVALLPLLSYFHIYCGPVAVNSVLDMISTPNHNKTLIQLTRNLMTPLSAKLTKLKMLVGIHVKNYVAHSRDTLTTP